MMGHHMGKVFVLKSSHGGRRGGLLGPKNTIFSPKRGYFGQSGPENGPLSGPTGTYKKTEGIHSYLRTWGRYDHIESGLAEAKIVGYMGVA